MNGLILIAVMLSTGPAPAADATNRPPQVAQTPAAVPLLRVAVDPRIELLSLLFRLAGNPEYNQARVESYTADVEKQFGGQRDHAAVKLARKLRETRGVSYDACMALAVHLNNADELLLLVPLEPWPEGLDRRWTAGSVTNFLAAARQFVKDTSFREFIRQHRPLYETTASRLETLLKKEGHLEWFHTYFGGRAQAAFTVTPGLLNGGGSYGPLCRDAAGQEQLYCILGVWQTDRAGLPEFASDVVGTVVHEFCHSYANALVARHEAELAAAGEKLFKHVADQMRSQAYGEAQTLLHESLVRACTVRYQCQYGGADAARREIDYNKNCGFVWTEELSNLLAEYEAQRDRYPTLESFAPRLVAFFNDYAEKFDREQTALAGRRPKVVSMIPANGAKDVDPGLTEIQVTFDRPMKNGSWAMVGGGPHDPESTGQPHYDSQRTTWSIPVRLKPGWSYEFHLNRGKYDSFRSEDGVPLASVFVTFTTAKSPTDKTESQPQ